MSTNNIQFNPGELCSRKLWQLIQSETNTALDQQLLREAVAELASRRHYLAELEHLGRLKSSASNS